MKNNDISEDNGKEEEQIDDVEEEEIMDDEEEMEREKCTRKSRGIT